MRGNRESSASTISFLGSVSTTGRFKHEDEREGMLKLEFHSQNIHVFWIKRKQEYPELVKFIGAIRQLLTFSSMVNIKSKNRNRL